MEKRTAEIIMVLKGNHNLREEAPEDVKNLGTYLHDLALYLSDDCWCPFSYCVEHPDCLDSIVQSAVLDYISSCENPRGFLWHYFDVKRLFGTDILPIREAVYNDTQCWCAALVAVSVRNGDKYINGFTEENTVSYKRERLFWLRAD